MLGADSWLSLVDDKLSPMDQFCEGEAIRIPRLESDFFAPVRNRLRMSTAGILDLQAPVSAASPRKRKQPPGTPTRNDEPVSPEGRKHAGRTRSEKEYDAIDLLGELKADMQTILGEIEMVREKQHRSKLDKLCARLQHVRLALDETKGKIHNFLDGDDGDV